jgi:hypothetical protein
VTPHEYLESAPIPFDLDGLDECYCDIDEIINVNFILEAESGKELVGKMRVRRQERGALAK